MTGLLVNLSNWLGASNFIDQLLRHEHLSALATCIKSWEVSLQLPAWWLHVYDMIVSATHFHWWRLIRDYIPNFQLFREFSFIVLGGLIVLWSVFNGGVNCTWLTGMKMYWQPQEHDHPLSIFQSHACPFTLARDAKNIHTWASKPLMNEVQNMLKVELNRWSNTCWDTSTVDANMMAQLRPLGSNSIDLNECPF